MIRCLLLSLAFLIFAEEQKHDFPNTREQSPVPVILDTDMDSDVDDVGALAMLHAYERQKKARILGIIVTSDEKYSASCTDAINRWFGRKDIPIGVSQKDSLRSFSKYTKEISEQFPNSFTNDFRPENATTVYRRLLANEPDGSVVIVTIRHLTSLSRLLESAPDSISSLGGGDLVKRKVRRWSCMGGQFPAGKEANFYRPDPASTVHCISKWRLPVTFAGWEVGNQIVTGGTSFKARSNPESPIYKAYELYNGFNGRASWDQIALLEAIEGTASYFTVKKDGHCAVAVDGSNKWTAPGNDLHGFITLTTPVDKIRSRIDQLMLGK
jgi:purine nucleosidase